MPRETLGAVLLAALAVGTSSTALAEERTQSKALAAFKAFPAVPDEIATACETVMENGTFKLLRCPGVGATYSYDANGTLNYMQIMRVPGVSTEKACRSFVESIAKGITANGSTKDKTAPWPNVRLYYYSGDLAYMAMWSDSKAMGKVCNVFACNTAAGPNALGSQNMCAKH